MREVRRSPKRGKQRWSGRAHRGWGISGGEAQIMVRGGSYSATDVDERSREGEGHLRHAQKGEWGWEGKKGRRCPFLNDTVVGQGREERGQWHSATCGEGDGGGGWGPTGGRCPDRQRPSHDTHRWHSAV
jgi:hypothetical protein